MFSQPPSNCFKDGTFKEIGVAVGVEVGVAVAVDVAVAVGEAVGDAVAVAVAVAVTVGVAVGVGVTVADELISPVLIQSVHVAPSAVVPGITPYMILIDS